jgi:hypothetical protein
MDFKAYLEDYFTGYEVTNELNYNYEGDETVFVIKNIGGGQNYLDSVIQPIQILAYTYDVDAAKALLGTFAQTKSGTMFVQNNEYIRQSYSTSFVIGDFASSGANHYSQVVISGTLIVSTNLSDIIKVEIDGFEYFTTGRDISYVTVEDTQPDDNRIGTTNIKQAIVTFICSMENKNNDVCNKISRLRQGKLDIDNAFIIKLTFSDNNRTETYTMKHHNSALKSTNSLSPVTVLTFVK